MQVEKEMEEYRGRMEEERKDMEEKHERERGELRKEIERLQESGETGNRERREVKREEREDLGTDMPTPKKFDKYLATATATRLSQENAELKQALQRSTAHHQFQLDQLHSDLHHHQYLSTQLQSQLYSKDMELAALQRSYSPIAQTCSSPIEPRFSLSSTGRTSEWRNATTRSRRDKTESELERVFLDLKESETLQGENEMQLKQEIKELATRLMQVRIAEKEAGYTLRSKSALRQVRPHSPAYRVVV